MNPDWNVIFGSAQEVLPALAPGSRDVCIADPPYGDTSLEWDSQVDGWIAEVARILKPNASIWVFGSMRFLAPLFAEMAAHGFKYSQDVVWEKQNGTGFHNDRFRRVHEHAVLFYRGAWADVYHDTQYTLDATAKTVRRKARATHWGAIDNAPFVSEDGGPRMMRSVLQIRNEHGKAVRPTQKPIDLILPLIRYSVPRGGSVLDPFMGSGSTGVACVQLGAKFTGIENKNEYVEIAKARISHEYLKDIL